MPKGNVYMSRHKRLKRILILLVLIVLALVGVMIYYKHVNPSDVSTVNDEMRQRVVDRSPYAYPNKTFMGVDLTGKTVEQIEDIFKKELDKYSARRVDLTVDKDKNIYSMRELGEHIGIHFSDGKDFEKGKENEAAKYIVNCDKNRSVADQVEILDGNADATQLDGQVYCRADQGSVERFVASLQKEYDKSPRDAKLTKKLKLIKEKKGTVLDTSAVNSELKEYLNSTKLNNLVLKYKTKKIKPNIRTSYLRPIKTNIGSYDTKFITTNARGRNIKKAANRLSGKLLKPGDEISFLDILYDDSDGEMYEESGGFLDDRVVQVEGGGICQVSTTAYVAFLRAGIIPQERHAHTCPVTYAPLGMDAALAVGVKDLIVKNTLKRPVFVQALVKKQRLYVNIFSYSDAKGGKMFVPRVKADKKRLTAKSYLDVKKNGSTIKTIKLAEDKYKKATGK